jgi:hypothetical protein
MNYPGKKIIKDISNYRFILKTIKKNKGTIEWDNLKLRADWIGRIYTVVNLPPEVIHSPDAPQEIRPAYVLDESRPVNEYLMKLNLQEIILPAIEAVPESLSYLIVYTPYFQKLSVKWVFYRILWLLLILWVQHKFGVLGMIKKILVQAYDFIF